MVLMTWFPVLVLVVGKNCDVRGSQTRIGRRGYCCPSRRARCWD